MIDVDCNLCGGAEKELLFDKDGFRHVRCRDCGLVYVTPRLSDHIGQQKILWDERDGRLDNIEQMGAQSYKRSKRRALVSEVAAYGKYRVTGRIMDIGCAFGGFLRAAREQGWEHPEGTEVAPQAVLYTSRFFPVVTDIAEVGPHKKGMFDVIRLNQVIEHVPDPKTLVCSVHEFLRPGGLFVVKTPNYESLSVAMCGSKWLHIMGDNHIYLFTPKTLGRLLEDAGFRVVGIETKGIHLTPKDQGGKRKSLSKHLSNRAVTYVERLLDLCVRHTRKGHRLKVLAEKI